MLGRTLRRTLATTAGTVAICLAGVASAQAAPPWLAPTVIVNSTTNVTQPAVTFTPNGTAYAVWAQYDGANFIVRTAARPPGGSFGAASPLSTAGGGADSPVIQSDRQGNVTAAWVRNGVVQARYRPAGSGWGPVQDLSDISASASAPQLAVGNNGNAIVAWANYSGAVQRVEQATRPTGSPVFASRAFVSPNAGSSIYGIPRVAMDAAGDAIVLWQQYIDVGGGVFHWLMRTNDRPVNTAFDPNATVNRSPTTGDAGSAQYWVRMAPNGRAIALWDFAEGSGAGSQYIQYADRTVGATFATGSWSGTGRASSATQNAFDASLALDDAGNAVSAWSIYDGSNYILQGATRQGFGGFGNLSPLSSTGGSVYSSVMAGSPNGNAVVLWNGSSGSDPAIFGAYRRPGNALGNVDVPLTTHPPTGSSTYYDTPDIALDNQGNGIGLVAQTNSTATTNTWRLNVLRFDPVAPSLSGVSVPGGATVGSPVGMSAQAFDRMSGVTVTWIFGDGATTTGASVAHAYGAPGAYTVTVRARDGAGNTTQTSRTISVVAAGGGGGGGSCVDADGDGFCAGQDCVDTNAKINPAAKEIRGNSTDEDCDGTAQPLPDLRSTVVPTWSVAGSKTTAVAFLLKGLKRGWKVTVSCKGAGCPFKSKKIKSKKTKKGNLNALKKLGSKRTFKAGSKLTVKFTARGYNTKYSIFKFKSGKIPNGVAKCRTNGTTRMRACR